MIVEPENKNNEIYNINNPSTNTANIQNPIETTTKTTVAPTPPHTTPNSETPAPPEEEEINPDDKSRIIAQIGDKITQYPSVIFILFNFIIYSYIIVYLIVIIKKCLLYLVLL